MNFFEMMHQKYAPEMNPREFSDHLNDFENEFFAENPDMLVWDSKNPNEDEAKQNAAIEAAYKKKHRVH